MLPISSYVFLKHISEQKLTIKKNDILNFFLFISLWQIVSSLRTVVFEPALELNDFCCDTDPFFDLYLPKYALSKFFPARMFAYNVHIKVQKQPQLAVHGAKSETFFI